MATARTTSLPQLSILASALAGRDVVVEYAEAGVPSWTDGGVIFVDAGLEYRKQVQSLCVQCALLSAGSLQPEIVRKFVRKPELAKRYLAIEGHRALSVLGDVLPMSLLELIDTGLAARSESPAASLAIAIGKDTLPDHQDVFGIIKPRALLASQAYVGGSASEGKHVPRQQSDKPLEELSAEADQNDEDVEDAASSPVGGGGGLGKLLQKMFEMVRQIKGGGSPGAEAATHWSRSGPRAKVQALRSTMRAESVDDASGKGAGILYPEWDVHRRCYRPDWCTVQELDPPVVKHANVAFLEGYGLRKPLSRLGMGLDRFHRQAQGDDIDIDALIEAQVEAKAGATPLGAVYIESQRRRRDLSVLILLDISGSVSQSSVAGATVHEQQRAVAAALATVLHEVGDRVSLFAFSSQGRSAVHMIPVKRFDENLDSRVMSRLHSLLPGAYSRLGAAIRHGSTLLIERSGTPRRLLVVLSDGLAYDHGYEPAYGAADARQALAEARRDGVGCLCLSVGSSTDTQTLRNVFGSAAHATIPKPNQLGQAIGPLFRSALRAAEVHRRVA